MRTAALTALLVLALAGCQTARTTGPDNSDASYELAKTVADTINRCWFGPGETAFAGYIYSPEPNNRPPRVLIVARDNPQGLPALVVEAHSANRLVGYGPLMSGPAGGRIGADLARWQRGANACA